MIHVVNVSGGLTSSSTAPHNRTVRPGKHASGFADTPLKMRICIAFLDDQERLLASKSSDWLMGALLASDEGSTCHPIGSMAP